MRRRIAIIGGGITGLAAAHRIVELYPSMEVSLLEAGDAVGGVLGTRRQDGFTLESAADGFLTSPPAAINLCERLGLADELQETNNACRRAMVVNRGRLSALPAGFQLMATGRLWPLLATPLLSWGGKLRAAGELLAPARLDEEDESLESFVCRRFGREVFDRLVQPLVGGIYAGDPSELGVEATFPRFRQMERMHGSLIRAMMRSRAQEQKTSGARYGEFKTLRGGLGSLVNALVDRLPKGSIALNSPAHSISPLDDKRWRVEIQGASRRTMDVDGVIVAAPARHTADLLRPIDSDLADELEQITFASCAIVSLGYRREQIGHPLDSFGFVVPLVENRMILSCSFSSVKYPGRAADDRVLLRVFIGGVCQRGLLRLPTKELAELAAREVAPLLKIQGDPILKDVVRQQRAMPQYHVGHRDRVARIDALLERRPSLALAGSSLYGVGVPACIQSGESAADRLIGHLKTRRTDDSAVVRLG